MSFQSFESTLIPYQENPIFKPLKTKCLDVYMKIWDGFK